MSDLIHDEERPRTHVRSPLMRESLMDRDLLTATETEREIDILPQVNVVSIGGRSILDRGKAALMPVLEEVVRCRAEHQILLGIGGGARVRHTYHICLDLGVPTGGMALVAGAVHTQNTRIVGALLAKHKGIPIDGDDFLNLSLWLEMGAIPILDGMPPYHIWEPPPGHPRVPSHGEDLGMFLVSEVLGARSMIFIKDEDGLYTEDPKKNPRAKFISEITAGELLGLDLPDMIVERMMVETMLQARHARRVQIINGLKPELLGRALAGEPVGTVITAQ